MSDPYCAMFPGHECYPVCRPPIHVSHSMWCSMAPVDHEYMRRWMKAHGQGIGEVVETEPCAACLELCAALGDVIYHHFEYPVWVIEEALV